MRMEYILIKKDKTKNNKNENFIVLPSSPLMLIEKNFNSNNIKSPLLLGDLVGDEKITEHYLCKEKNKKNEFEQINLFE